MDCNEMVPARSNIAIKPRNLKKDKSMNNSVRPKGVYFLANNTVFDLAVAFLRSFRLHNPSIPLCLIPYNADFDSIAALKDAYNFSIFDNDALLQACDEISHQFHGRVLGAYRKLVAWEGMFDSFLYIDIDTVLTDSVDFAFDYFLHGQYIASHSNIAHNRKWVWTDAIYETHLLTPPQIEFSANTGFFASVRGLLPMEHCSAKVSQALALRDCMELHCMEQPYINYLVVTSGYRYNSLSVLRESGAAPAARLEWWGGTPNARVDNGRLFSPLGDPIFLVHWAGIFQSLRENLMDELPYEELWEYYRRRDLAPDMLLDGHGALSTNGAR